MKSGVCNTALCDVHCLLRDVYCVVNATLITAGRVHWGTLGPNLTGKQEGLGRRQAHANEGWAKIKNVFKPRL